MSPAKFLSPVQDHAIAILKLIGVTTPVLRKPHFSKPTEISLLPFAIHDLITATAKVNGASIPSDFVINE